jgi:hypothetical protein
MLAEGKITVEEAQRLLSALNEGKNGGEQTKDQPKPKSMPRYMYVVVEPKPGGPRRETTARVNVRVPFSLIRAGMKLTTLIPHDAADKVNDAFKEKGIPFDFSKIKDEDIEALVTALRDSEVNVDSEYETVRVYAE